MLLTTEQAAEWLGLKSVTLKAYRTKGGGPAFHKLGRAVRYDIADLQAWVDARRRRHSQEYDPYTGKAYGGTNGAPRT